MVEPYLDHGDREYSAQILQTWSPAIDTDDDIGQALHHAIFLGDEAAVRMIIDAGVDPAVQQVCDPGFTPLLAASQHGRREMARLFWQLAGPDGRFYPSTRHKGRKPTCLQVAAQNGHADLVAGFLDAWDGWAADEKRRTLRDAARAWCDDAVVLLLARIPYEADDIQEALEEAVGHIAILPETPTRKPLRGTAEDSLRQQRLVCRLIDAGGNPD